MLAEPRPANAAQALWLQNLTSSTSTYVNRRQDKTSLVFCRATSSPRRSRHEREVTNDCSETKACCTDRSVGSVQRRVRLLRRSEITAAEVARDEPLQDPDERARHDVFDRAGRVLPSHTVRDRAGFGSRAVSSRL